MDSGTATALKIVNNNNSTASGGAMTSLYKSGPNQNGQHTANGESTWYRERVRFPSGKYYAVANNWNIITEWHSATPLCGALNSALVVMGSGPNSSQPATTLKFGFLLRGGQPASSSGCSDATQSLSFTAPTTINLDQWYDVVMHFIWKPSGGQMDFYVDGQLLKSWTNVSTLLTYNGQVDNPGLGLYNYRQNLINVDSQVEFDQFLWGPTADSVGFTP